MSRPSVMVDLVRARNLNTGLGQVAWHFGQALLAQRPSLDLRFLVPRERAHLFAGEVRHVAPSAWRRVLPGLGGRVDLWHATHQDSSFPPPRGSRYLLTIHDLNFLGEKTPAKARKRLQKLQGRVDRATAVVLTSAFTEKTAHEHLTFRVPTHVISNGAVGPDPAQAQRPDFLPEGPFVLAIGVMRAKKNFHTLIDFVHGLPELRLVIAGSGTGPYLERMRSRVAELDLKDRVVLCGPVSEEEKSWLYHHCQAFLFPSLFEGFGLPAVEALHAGRPVFLSTHSSLPEVGRDAAFYWPDFHPEAMRAIYREKMALVAQDPEAHAARARARGRDFPWSKTAAEHVALYRELLAAD